MYQLREDKKPKKDNLTFITFYWVALLSTYHAIEISPARNLIA